MHAKLLATEDTRQGREAFLEKQKPSTVVGETKSGFSQGECMVDFYVEKGQTSSFTKTVSESDVFLFAGITGDFSPNHVNKAYMEKSHYGKLMAHGALMVGFMSTVSTMAIAHTRDADETPVSVGYDKVRFLKPVFLGDTITVEYTISEIELDKKRSYADIKICNQVGELVAVGKHILQWIPNPSENTEG